MAVAQNAEFISVKAMGRLEWSQRMAAPPRRLRGPGALRRYDGNVTARGVVTAWEALEAKTLIERLMAAGCESTEH